MDGCFTFPKTKQVEFRFHLFVASGPQWRPLVGWYSGEGEGASFSRCPGKYIQNDEGSDSWRGHKGVHRFWAQPGAAKGASWRVPQAWGHDDLDS